MVVYGSYRYFSYKVYKVILPWALLLSFYYDPSCEWGTIMTVITYISILAFNVLNPANLEPRTQKYY